MYSLQSRSGEVKSGTVEKSSPFTSVVNVQRQETPCGLWAVKDVSSREMTYLEKSKELFLISSSQRRVEDSHQETQKYVSTTGVRNIFFDKK